MKWCILLLALLQSLGCLCFPAANVGPMADKALAASLAEFNTRHAVTNLYRATRATAKVVNLGLNTHDLLMKFDLKETQCPKGSGQDAQTCAFQASLFVPSYSCTSRVRFASAIAQVVTLNCGRDHSSSSSSESSEEVYSRGRHQYSVPGLNSAPYLPPPTAHPASPQTQGRTGQPRGDSFNNITTSSNKKAVRTIWTWDE